MPLLPYDYLHLVNCPEVFTISDNYSNCIFFKFTKNSENLATVVAAGGGVGRVISAMGALVGVRVRRTSVLSVAHSSQRPLES